MVLYPRREAFFKVSLKNIGKNKYWIEIEQPINKRKFDL
jgi:hypothetical protein